MRSTALTCAFLAVGFVAFAGAGCDQRVLGGGAPTCVSEMGPTGVCKRCYDQAGKLLTEDCPPPPETGMVRCNESAGPNGRPCKTCVDTNGKVVSTDCNATVPETTCMKIEDGGPTSCKDPGTWKMYGVAACSQQNLQLTDVVGGVTCDAGYQTVTYVCCGNASGGTGGTGGSTSTGMGGAGGSVGGGDQKCIRFDEGAAGTCNTYDTLKRQAYDDCLQQNFLLTGIAVGPVCDAGFEWITVTCCGMPATPPPTTGSGGSSGGSGGSGGGGMCIAINDGGPSSCKDAETWKRYGTESCGQQGLALADVKWAIACGAGYSQVTYLCCPPPPLD